MACTDCGELYSTPNFIGLLVMDSQRHRKVLLSMTSLIIMSAKWLTFIYQSATFCCTPLPTTERYSYPFFCKSWKCWSTSRTISRISATEPKNVNVTGCFLELPIIRQCGGYAVDKNSTTDSCRKLKRGHKALLPGLFLLLQCEHGE